MAPSVGEAYGEPAAKPGCMLGIIFGAIIGGSCAGLIFVARLHFEWNLKSSDFLSAVLSALGVMLAGISVLLALLALALAVGAIYGWQEFKRRTSETAAQRAADVAGPAAVEVAVPAAIKQVEQYLDKNLDPEIRQKAISIVGQIITADFIRSIIDNKPSPDIKKGDEADAEEWQFSGKAVEAAADEEVNRQEEALDAFDAIVEADAIRGGNDPKGGEDV
jgi:hypothetical protein